MTAGPPVCDFGWKAPNFSLPATDGKTYSLQNISGPKGTLVMFICNHCPFVLSVLDRILRDARDMQTLGIGVAAINANDVITYPDDSFDNMRKMACKNGFSFPYLFDGTQEIARAYDAVCTPDFFGFNCDLELQYRGRLDSSGRIAGPVDLRRDLFEAMRLVAATDPGP